MHWLWHYSYLVPSVATWWWRSCSGSFQAGEGRGDRATGPFICFQHLSTSELLTLAAFQDSSPQTCQDDNLGHICQGKASKGSSQAWLPSWRSPSTIDSGNDVVTSWERTREAELPMEHQEIWHLPRTQTPKTCSVSSSMSLCCWQITPSPWQQQNPTAFIMCFLNNPEQAFPLHFACLKVSCGLSALKCHLQMGQG